MLDNAGDRNSTFSFIPFGSSTMANLKSLGSGNLGIFPPRQQQVVVLLSHKKYRYNCCCNRVSRYTAFFKLR